MVAPAGPHDAHDRFFKYVFAPPEAMAVLLRRMLSPELLSHLDASTLARTTPTRLSMILDVPPGLREILPTPIEVIAHADDFSGSVLDDPIADRTVLARVELARAFLHAYKNPGSLTEARMATLAPLFDVLLDQPEPLASKDIEALLTYVVHVFEPGSPVRHAVEAAIHNKRRAREMYVTIADSWIAEGRARSVLEVLELRKLSVPADARERVLAMHDESQLQRWLARALTVSSTDEIFDPINP